MTSADVVLKAAVPQAKEKGKRCLALLRWRSSIATMLVKPLSHATMSGVLVERVLVGGDSWLR